jgi:putative spermidine/putrescine transport system permease protein
MVTQVLPRLTTADGVPLRISLRRAGRRSQLRDLALVAPLLAFIVVSFIIPIGTMLYCAIDNPEIVQNLPRTVQALQDWNGDGVPGEGTFAALAADLKDTQHAHTTTIVGRRLNYEIPGMRDVVLDTARSVSRRDSGPWKPIFLKADPTWGQHDLWMTLQRAGHRFTSYYLLAALDLRWNGQNQLARVPADQAIFVDVLLRTFWISFLVTLATLLLGYPVAYLLATLPVRTGNLLLILVLLPFWTSLLVRTTAWVVLLQTHGVINDTLAWLHLIDHPLRLIYERAGTVTAMTHIQLPFTLLPIYSVMKTISPTYQRAARSLGAGPFHAFWRVYFPQTLPGVGAGCLLTFILSLGYYITPALVGGPLDQMVGYFVALYTNQELNWGMASALGTVLLAVTLGLYVIYNRLVGIDKMRLG